MIDHLHQTDVAIIGAGPTGLFAVFECGMMRLKCHVIDPLEMVGGQCSALYPEKPIYDIPAYPKIGAQELIDNLMTQIKPFHPEFHLGQQVMKLERTQGNRWMLSTDHGTTIVAKAVIIAAGVGAFGPNRPPLEGIENYEGQSIFYYVKSRENFRDKRVLIAGGGDSAVDWAISLAEVAKSVGVVHRRPKFRCAPESEAKLHELEKAGKIELLIPYQLEGLKGQGDQLDSVVLKSLEGEEKDYPCDVLLPFYGLAMNLGPILEWDLALHHNHIEVNPQSCATSLEGVFAIGDIATYPGKLKLILTGFAEGAHAAHAARAIAHPGETLHFEYSTTSGVLGIA
ncbi:NAD(P)/FAD-dependent oxidoreductase [Candidatus Bealeia paramacronuclearis]|uniref:Ferredoxin--NADP reductase n=1 Tax=Candidatus Bealeia paramacronuclearis TaxID=1921001 RepID=A0ABZ2C422_9PROT|nr:NAD(P)/FAD-dependent oxidoreductase [Candidatus Bealeia paramacronuclearis]